MLVYLFTLLFLAIVVLTGRWRPAATNKVAAAFRGSIHKFARTVLYVGLGFSSVQLLLVILPSASFISLLDLERMLVALKSYVALVKVPTSVQLCVLTLLLGCGVVSTRLAKLELMGRFTRATGYVAKANLLLTLITSVTFFGTGTAPSVAHTEAQLVENISDLERGYAEVTAEAQQLAADLVADELAKPLAFQALVKTTSELTHAAAELKPFRLFSAPLRSGPQVYRITDDLARTSDGLRELTSAKPASRLLESVSLPKHVRAQITSAHNRLMLDRFKAIRSERVASEAQTILREILGAICSNGTEPLTKMLASLVPEDAPGHLAKLFVSKMVTAPAQKLVIDGTVSLMDSVYHRGLDPQATIAAIRSDAAAHVADHVQLTPSDTAQLELRIKDTSRKLSSTSKSMAKEADELARRGALPRFPPLKGNGPLKTPKAKGGSLFGGILVGTLEIAVPLLVEWTQSESYPTCTVEIGGKEYPSRCDSPTNQEPIAKPSKREATDSSKAIAEE